jgi:hypothetical protein
MKFKVLHTLFTRLGILGMVLVLGLGVLGVKPASASSASSAPILVSPANGTFISSTRRPIFTWESVPGAVKYQIAISKSYRLDRPFVESAIVSTLSYTPTGNLPTNVKLFWSVRVIKAGGNIGSWAKPYFSFKIGLAIPTLISPAYKALGVVRQPNFKWSAVNGASGYILHVSTSPGFSTEAINVFVVSTSYIPTTSLDGGKVYYWQVRASGPFASSDWSDVFIFTTKP